MFKPIVLAVAAAFCLFAQNPTATLVGTVGDASGAVVPDAKLEVRNVNTNESRKVSTDIRGVFTAPNLSPGPYEVTISKAGFRTVRETGLVLQMEQVARMEFRLEVSELSQSVEVTAAAAPLINTENGTQGQVITADEIGQMPLNGRDFSDLAVLVPGVTPNVTAGQGSEFAINGARADNTNFFIDGFSDRDPSGGGVQQRPNLDAVQEFKMQTSNFSAEYGQLAGGMMNMVLKSGGNKFHGALFEFLRNDRFDARNFFDAAKSKLRRNQFGGLLNGPVWIPKVYDGHNRTFFLFSWESFRQVQGASLLGVVPTVAERSGDYSQAGPIADPLSTGTCPGSTGSRGGCFAGNRIPSSRLSPQALAAQAYYPLPNRPGQVNNLAAYPVAPNDWDSWVVKIDQRMSSKDTVSGRYTLRNTTTHNPTAGQTSVNGNNTGLFGQFSNNRQALAGLNYTRVFGPTLINEARLGFTRTDSVTTPAFQGTDYNAKFGITGTTTDPRMVGFPLIMLSGLLQLGPNSTAPTDSVVNTFQLGDTLTWVKGTHLLKFGSDILHTQFYQPQWNNVRGTFNFSGFWTGRTYADFLLGYLNSDSRQVGSTNYYLLSTNYGFFAQDDWKVGRRLTLNVGMRYEIPGPPYEKRGQWANFVPGLNKLVLASGEGIRAGVGFSNPEVAATASELGLPKSLTYGSRVAFAPRFGFAWRPLGGNRMVVRGGYGIFYGSQIQNPLRGSMAAIFPFVVTQTNNRNATSPLALSLADPFPAAPNLTGNLATLTLGGFELHAHTPYLQSWNLTLEKEVGFSSSLQVAYTGSKGTHLGLQVNINQPYDRSAENPTGITSYPGFGTINYFTLEANSIYNAGTVTWRRRFTRGFFYTLNYTFSKSIDEGSRFSGFSNGGISGLQNTRNLRGDRSRSDWDIPHQFTMSFSWTSPLRNVFLNGWQISGTGRMYSGAPFTATVTNANLNLGEASRPNRTGKGTLPNPSPNRWFDIAAFPRVPQGSFTFGNSGRNVLDGAGRMEANLTLSKNFALWERHRLQVRWEVFNALNRANFALPQNAVNAANAATIVSASNGRLMQLGLRYEF
jgi:hypothetical protein